jgi:hypothetical protein
MPGLSRQNYKAALIGAAGELASRRLLFVPGHVLQVLLAICLVGGTLWASHPGLPPAAEGSQEAAAPVIAKLESDVLNLRTGDTFWGLHVDGVVPCSSMIIKGGGHLVTLSVHRDHEAHCVFHVVKEKRIDLNGNSFRLRVTAADQIHVERAPASQDVATNP